MADITCRQSAGYFHDADRDGNCRWCGQKVDGKVQAPEHYNEVSELGLMYGYYYDPDFEWPERI